LKENPENQSNSEAIQRLEKELQALKNVLRSQMPDNVVEDLQKGRSVAPQNHDSATVMFTDIRNFTQIVDNYSAEQLVNILDKYFNVFDDTLDKYQVRKIKTIGDSYMCASGLLADVTDHAFRVLLAALEMKDFIDNKKREMINKDSDYMELRFGIHTGEVVAGMVGKTNKVYDLWGKTVNIAHRMEESATVQSINISGSTFEMVWPFFDVTYRGKLPVKNKGVLQMYGVHGLNTKYSKDNSRYEPNELFWKRIKIHLEHPVQYELFEKETLKFLKDNLNTNLHYHCLDHTKEVIAAVDVICEGEELSANEYIVLKAAAVLHDIGFVRSPDRHEEHSVEIARQWLPKYGFSGDMIEEICSCISSTKMGFVANNKLQQLLIDADLFYLGTNNYFKHAENLKEEFGFLGREFDNTEWLDVQINFLNQHQYYRTYAKKHLEPNKRKVLDTLKIERNNP
jgi:class 3 adenylate cyclase/predicted metal-dependent HD superfamily phosphohydrolase